MKRIFHTWEKWECYPAGFYENKPRDKTLTDDQCRELYATFLRDIVMFEAAMQSIILQWPRSCEHYLTNERMNRIAWLGQASMCYAHGVPAIFSGGFQRLTEDEQSQANLAALKWLNKWLDKRGEPPVALEKAMPDIKANLY
jgi:hypothetical protein